MGCCMAKWCPAWAALAGYGAHAQEWGIVRDGSNMGCGRDGACPPAGEKHHYQFTIYAMRDALAFYPLSAIGRSTVNWLRDNSLAHTTLTVTYQR